MKLVFVYITAGSLGEARRIGRALVAARLAACVNISGPIRSVYRWKGKVREGREWSLIVKTRAARVAVLVRKVKALHRYEVPCIVALPILKGNPAFLEWIGAATSRTS
jgi:periplasmic divalent cation tolerance protein